MQRTITLASLALLLVVGAAKAATTNTASTLGQCPNAGASITTGTACAGGTTSTNTGAAINTSGSSIIIVCGMVFNGSAETLGTISDNKSNTWTVLTEYHTGNHYVKMWYAIPSSSSKIGTGHTFTFSATGVSGFNTIAVASFVGTAGSTAIRSSTDTGAATGTNLTITPTATHDLLMSCEADDLTTAKTINGSFTVLQSTTTTANGETAGIAWQDAPSTSAVTWTWNASLVGEQNGAAFVVGAAPTSSSSNTPGHASVM